MNDSMEQLSSTGAYVLEEWGMMMVDTSPGLEEDFDWSERFYCATARFHGSSDGTLTVACQRRFLDGLVRSVTGAAGENEVGEADELDALRELANVVCGNFLVAAYGEGATFDLPNIKVEAHNGDELRHYVGGSQEVFCCRADDEPVVFLLTVDR